MDQFSSGFRWGHRHGRGYEQLQQQDAALLRSLPMPTTPAVLLEPVKVRVLQAFCVNGKPVEVGAVITLPRFDALDAKALGRAELVG